MRNKSDGQLVPGSTVVLPGPPAGLGRKDVDCDGDADLVTLFGTTRIRVYRNDGQGDFSSENFIELVAGGFVLQLQLADKDGDGKPDLVLYRRDAQLGTVVTIVFNFEGITFDREIVIVGQVGDLVDMVASDLDGDGDGAGQVSVHGNNGDGSFADPVSEPTGNGPFDLDVGDLDGDGFSDVVVANLFDSTIQSFLGGGDGTLLDAGTFATVAFPRTVVLADLDGDGALAAGDTDGDGATDLLSANFRSNNVSILLNNTGASGPPCPEDVGGDGQVGFADLLAVLAAWGPCP